MAPIRTVQDTVAKSAKYSMDPFCPSYMDYQRRAEDELAKFLYIVVKRASKMSLKISYYIYVPADRNFEPTFNFNKALESGSVLDLRWQLKHLIGFKNRSLYYNSVFRPSWTLNEFINLLNYIKQKGNNLAHKKHLRDQLRGQQTVGVKSGTFNDINDLLDGMINLADMIYNAMQHMQKIVPVSACT